MNTNPQGVYYAVSNYAGLGRRLLILLVDGLVVLVVYVASMIAFALGLLGTSFNYYAFMFAGFCYLYLAILGRSKLGTLGYALTSVKVVDLEGRQPSIACMTFRSLFAVLGPLNAILDLFWLGGDVNRQALRDKLAGTYVIRRGAEPEGTGVQRHVMISFLGWNLLVREVAKKVT